MKKYLVALFVMAFFCSAAQAVLITVGGDQTDGTGTLTFNEDAVFTATSTTVGTLLFVFDEVVTSDGSLDNVNFSGLEFSINGGPRYAIANWTDNYTGNYRALTPNDAYIYYQPNVGITNGDIVTIHAGTGTMNESAPNFNSWSSGDYQMFLSVAGHQMSSVIPEPSTFMMLGVAGGLLFIIRRRNGWRLYRQ